MTPEAWTSGLVLAVATLVYVYGEVVAWIRRGSR